MKAKYIGYGGHMFRLGYAVYIGWGGLKPTRNERRIGAGFANLSHHREGRREQVQSELVHRQCDSNERIDFDAFTKYKLQERVSDKH